MVTSNTTITGGLVVLGDITGAYVRGDGSNLTNIPLSHISGASGHAAYFDGVAETVTHEVALATSRGGTGTSSSASTGRVTVFNGSWNMDSNSSYLMNVNTKLVNGVYVISTTNATPTAIIAVDMTPEGAGTKTSADVRVSVLSVRNGDLAAKVNTRCWECVYKITYNTSGNVFDVQTLSKITSGTLATHDVTIATVSPNFSIMVTGGVSNVDWVADIECVVKSFA